MNVERLVEVFERINTRSYDMNTKEKEIFNIIHQRKISMAFNNLDYYLDLMKEEAENGFEDLLPNKQLRILKLRIWQAKDYILEQSGFYETELHNYMNFVTEKVGEIYRPFMKISLESARNFKIIAEKKELKKLHL